MKNLLFVPCGNQHFYFAIFCIQGLQKNTALKILQINFFQNRIDPAGQYGILYLSARKRQNFGALAQLGARHNGIVEATGSNPVCSIAWKR